MSAVGARPESGESGTQHERQRGALDKGMEGGKHGVPGLSIKRYHLQATLSIELGQQRSEAASHIGRVMCAECTLDPTTQISDNEGTELEGTLGTVI